MQWSDGRRIQETVSELHHHVAEWSGWVNSLDKIWDSTDAKIFEDFVPVPCNKEDAGITRRKVLHGSVLALLTVAQCYRGLWVLGYYCY